MANIFILGSFFAGITVRVPRIPVLGEALIGDLFDYGPGGKGTNQAIAATRLGAQVCLLAGVGEDIFGDMAMSLYQKEGVSREFIHQFPGINTGVGCVTLLPTGENMIVGHLGANARLLPEHVDAAESKIAKSDILLSQFEAPIDVTRTLRLAHVPNDQVGQVDEEPERPGCRINLPVNEQDRQIAQYFRLAATVL